METTSKTKGSHPTPALWLVRIQSAFTNFNRPVTITLEQVTIFFLTLLGILSRFLGLGNRVMSHDESLHVYYSWLLSTGKGFIHTPMMHGPFLFESTALVNLLIGANDFTSRLLPAILGSFIAIVIPQLLKPWIGRIGALIGSALFLVSPFMLYYSRYIRHDTIVIAWVLLAVFAMVGYLLRRKESYLVIFVVALALMFATMEITFFYLAIFASFVFVRMLWTHGLRWKAIRTSAEFDLLALMITLGAFFSSAIALPLLNSLFTRITGAAFVDMTILENQDSMWSSGPSGIRLWQLFGLFSAVGSALGYVWGKRRWLKLAALFLGINILLFTTFLTNPAGIASGFIGSLGYWLAQQGVARGGQPWYYFLIVVPMYEFLPLIGGIGASIFFAFRRKKVSDLARVFVPFTIWWAIGILLALTVAGEKMPWHSTHIIVPFILLTAWWLGHLIEAIASGQDRRSTKWKWFSRMVLLGFGILFLPTMRTAFFVNYVNYDSSTEYIDYARGAPGVKWVLNDLQAIANHTGAGKNLKIAFGDEVAWPMSWYLKDYPNQSFYGAQPTREALDAPVVISGPKDWQKVEALLGPNYHRFEVIRMWWSIEDYKDLTGERIWNVLVIPEMRAALWEILWNRDYSRYASLTGATLNPPTDWPLAEKMRVYIRKDIAQQMLSLSLGGTILPDISAQEDAYAGIMREIQPEQIVQTGELNEPRNMTVGKDGNLYVVDSGNSRVVKFNAKGEFLNAWGSRTPDGQLPPAPGTFLEPWGIIADGDGNILVADTWNHRIQKFDSDGKFLGEWGLAGQVGDGVDRLWGPRGLAVSPDGKIYVTDAGNKRIVVFSSTGAALFEFGTNEDGRLDEPVGIAFGPDGNLYVADTWNRRVAIFSAGGKYRSSFPVQAWASGSIDNKPYLAVDRENRVLVTDPEGYRVLAFSPDGKPLLGFGRYGPEEESFGLPNGIVLGPDDHVWITDAGNNRLVRFSNPLP